ncbi:hypothetical protein P9112_012660 [Eukaryota sp. TZLM1-RC]
MEELDLSKGDTPVPQRPTNRAELLKQRHQLNVQLSSPRQPTSARQSVSDDVLLQSLLTSLRDTSSHWFNRLTALRKLQSLLKSSSIDVQSQSQSLFDVVLLQFQENRHSLTQSALLTLNTLSDVLKQSFLPIITPHLSSIIALCRSTDAESVVSNAALTIKNVIQSCSLNRQVLDALIHTITNNDVPAACNACSQALVCGIRKGIDSELIDVLIDWLRHDFELIEQCSYRKPIYTTLVDSGLWKSSENDEGSKMSPADSNIDLALDQTEPMEPCTPQPTVLQPLEVEKVDKSGGGNDDLNTGEERAEETESKVLEIPVEKEEVPETVQNQIENVSEVKLNSEPLATNITSTEESDSSNNNQKYIDELEKRIELQDLLSQYEVAFNNLIDNQNELVATSMRSLLIENGELNSKYDELELSFKQLSLRYEELKRLVVNLKKNEQILQSRLAETTNHKEALDSKYTHLKEKAEAALEEAKKSTEVYRQREAVLKGKVGELEVLVAQKDEEITRLQKNMSGFEKKIKNLTSQNEELSNGKNDLELELTKLKSLTQSAQNDLKNADSRVQAAEAKVAAEVAKTNAAQDQVSVLEGKVSVLESQLQSQMEDLSSAKTLQDENARLKGRLYDSMEKIKELESRAIDSSPVTSSLEEQLAEKEAECQQLFVMCENIVKEMEEVTAKNKQLEEQLKTS